MSESTNQTFGGEVAPPRAVPLGARQPAMAAATNQRNMTSPKKNLPAEPLSNSRALIRLQTRTHQGALCTLQAGFSSVISGFGRVPVEVRKMG